MSAGHPSSQSVLGGGLGVSQVHTNLDSFAKNRGLIVGERVDHVAANH
jgi:hypothetical protein